LRILFMGTPRFACPPLKRLICEEEVIGVVTQPDRPSGRGRKLVPSPVKQLAEKKGIPLYQPSRVNQSSFICQVKRIAPDLIVSAAFGQILSPEFLSIPKICCINLHPSLLPRYRGPAPVQRAIIRGEKETGVTVQRMEEEVDKGMIILQRKIPIDISDTAGDLEEKLSLLGADVLIEVIRKIKEGSVEYIPQNEAEASYAPKIKKEEGRIDWSEPSLKIHNKVRGLNPYPGAFTLSKQHKKILPGEIFQIKKEIGFMVKTGDGMLLIKRMQLPDRKPISGYDFIKGYQIKEGVILGG